ncbi:MAG: hypothetical protein AAF333_19400 [Planctomycetota bacterium]
MDDSTPTPGNPDTPAVSLPPAPPPSLNPNEALDLLGDLEARLGKLKSWQAENDKHAEQVRTQAEQIAHREQQIAEQTQSLQTDRDALEQDRVALAADRDALQTEQQQLEESRTQLDQNRGELEQAKQQFAQQEEDLKQRAAAIDERAQQIDGRIAELDERQTDLDRQQAELVRQRQDIEAQWAEIDAARQQIEQTTQEIDTTRGQLEKDRSTLKQDRETFEGERAQFAEQRQYLKDRKQDLAKAQMDLKIRQDALEAQQASLEKMRSELAEQAGSFGNDDTLMPGFIPDLSGKKEPAAQPDQGAAAQELKAREEALWAEEAAFQEKQEAFRETLEHSKAKVLSERQQVQDGEKAVQELAEELEQQQQAMAARQQELDARAEELEQLRRELDERVDSTETTAGTVLVGDTLAAAEPADTSALDQRAAELDDAQAKLDAERAALGQQSRSLEEQRAVLDAREAELDQRAIDLDERAAALDAGQAQGLNDDEKDARIAELATELDAFKAKYQRRKAQMLKADAVIKKRRDKVRSYLQQLREHSKNIQAAETKVESSSAQYAGLDKERRNLIEVKKFLEASEREMVTRWATRSTASLVATIILAMLGAVVVSYFVGQQLTKPVWQSSMAFSVTPPPSSADLVTEAETELPSPELDPAAAAYLAETAGEPGADAAPDATAPAAPAAEPGTADAWFAEFKEDLTSPTVMNETLSQLDQRDIRLFTSPTQLAVHFDEHLTVAGNPGRVELTYSSTQPEFVVGVLDALGKAIVAYQMSLDRANGVSDSIKILQKAERNATAVQDDSLKYMAISFASIAGVALVLGLLIRVALGRSRRLMAEADDIPVLATLGQPPA